MENRLRVGPYQLELFLILSSSQKREREGVPETSVTNQPTLRNNPEERQSQIHCGESPKFPNNLVNTDIKFVWSQNYSCDLVASSHITIGNFL
jgi:hypothetical protein